MHNGVTVELEDSPGVDGADSSDLALLRRVGQQDRSPVENVVVTGTFSGACNQTASAVTNTKGRAVVTTSTRIDSVQPFTLCVESLEHVGASCDSSNNGEICDSL